MATFGNTNVGTTYDDWLEMNNYKAVSKFTLSEAGDVSKLTVYIRNTHEAAQKFKGIIYDDNGTDGAPGTLLGTSAESSQAASTTGWVDATFAAAVELDAGDYWLGFIGGEAADGNVDSPTGSSSTTTYGRSDTYSDGPSNPFGASEWGPTNALSVYATYTAAATSALPFFADLCGGLNDDFTGGM